MLKNILNKLKPDTVVKNLVNTISAEIYTQATKREYIKINISQLEIVIQNTVPDTTLVIGKILDELHRQNVNHLITKHSILFAL